MHSSSLASFLQHYIPLPAPASANGFQSSPLAPDRPKPIAINHQQCQSRLPGVSKSLDCLPCLVSNSWQQHQQVASVSFQFRKTHNSACNCHRSLIAHYCDDTRTVSTGFHSPPVQRVLLIRASGNSATIWRQLLA